MARAGAAALPLQPVHHEEAELRAEIARVAESAGLVETSPA